MIAASIVLYNPDINRLEENIDAVISQVSRLYLWDNASNNLNAIEVLLRARFADRPIEIIYSEENAGLPMAYNALCTRAAGDGFTSLFLLDQDSVTGDGCVSRLAELLESREEGTVGIAAARYIDRNARPQDNASSCSGVQEVDRTITSGSLLSLEAWRSVGGYDELLFIDWVDYDFCYRLTQAGFSILVDNSVYILHEIGHREFAGYLPMRDAQGSWRLAPQYRLNHSYERRFDQARSIAIVREKNRDNELGKRETAAFVKETITRFIVERKRIQFLKARIMGWRAGIEAFRANEKSSE